MPGQSRQRKKTCREIASLEGGGMKLLVHDDAATFTGWPNR